MKVYVVKSNHFPPDPREPMVCDAYRTVRTTLLEARMDCVDLEKKYKIYRLKAYVVEVDTKTQEESYL